MNETPIQSLLLQSLADCATQPLQNIGTATMDEMAAPVASSATLQAGGTLVDSTTYYYVVSAYDGLGETLQSNEVNATPTGTDLSVLVSWAAVTGAASYKLFRSTTTGTYGASSLLASGITTTSYTDTGAATSSGQPLTTATAGFLTLAKDPVSAMHAATKQYVDSVAGVTAGNGLVSASGTMHFAQSSSYTTGAIPFAGSTTTITFDATTFLWDNTNKRLGVGTGSPGAIIDAAATNTATTGSIYGLRSTLAIANTSDSDGTYYGAAIYANKTTGGGDLISAGIVIGAYIENRNNTTQSINAITGIQVRGGNTAAGTVSQLTGMEILSPSNGSGTISTAYGIYIDSQHVGSTGASYGIYVAGTSDANFFGGKVGIGASAGASAMLQVDSTTSGFLPPRMTTTQRNSIASPATGLLIFNTSTALLNYWDGSAWGAFITSTTSGTVTSVAMSVPSILNVSGSPITTSGTLAVTLATQSSNTVFAGPSSGSAATPAFRALVGDDIPLGNGLVSGSGTIHFASSSAYTAGAIPFASSTSAMGFDASNLFWDGSNHRLGIGTATPSYQVDFSQSSTATSGTQIGARIVYSLANSSSSSGDFFGMAIYSNVNGTAAVTGTNTGILIEAKNNTTFTVHSITGLQFSWGNSTTGTISNNVALQILSPQNNGTITNAYGLVIQPVKIGSTTNAFGIYQSGANDLNYLAGNTGIGTSSAGASLHVLLTDSATNAVSLASIIGHNSSGTPAAGFGSRLRFNLKSSTTNAQDAAAIDAIWTDATHASRTAKLSWSLVNGAAALAVFMSLTPTSLILSTGVMMSADNVYISQTTLTYAATTDIDFSLAGYRKLALTGDVTFTTSNLAAGRTVVIRILCDSTGRTFTFPSGWIFVGTKPTGIAASKTGILTLTSEATTDADVKAAYAEQT